MNKHILYYSHLCQDTEDFIAELESQNLEYEARNISDNLEYLKEFLKLRDNKPIFDDVKKFNRIGIPFLVTKDSKYILDLNDLNGTGCSITKFEK